MLHFKKVCVCVYNDSLMRTALKICGHSRFGRWIASTAELSCEVRQFLTFFVYVPGLKNFEKKSFFS